MRTHVAVLLAAFAAWEPVAAQSSNPAQSNPTPATRAGKAPSAQRQARTPTTRDPAATASALSRDRLMSLAASEFDAGRQAEAAKLYADAARRFNSVQALLRLSRIQAGSKDPRGALESLSRARALAPNSEEVLNGYAQVSLSAGFIMPAVFTLQGLSRMCSTVAQYHYLLGVGLLQAGDAVSSVESLKEADRLEPNRPLTMIALGIAYNSRKQFADAKPLLLRGLELEPDSIDALAALAESEEGLGELDQAESHAQRALARAPDHANGNLVIGLVLMKRERYAEARDAFLRSSASEPRLPKAYYQASLAYARLGDEANARVQLELYQKALREMDDRVNAIQNATGPSMGGMHP